MSSYILRKIDPDLWRQVKSKCALAGISVKVLIEQLLTDWVKQPVTYRIVEAEGLYVVQSNVNPINTQLWVSLDTCREESHARSLVEFMVKREQARLIADNPERLAKEGRIRL